KFLAPGDEPALALGAVRVGPVAERDRGDGLVVVRQEMRDRPPLVEVRQVLANLSRPWGVDAPIRRCACVPTLVTPVRAMIFTVIARPIYQTLLARMPPGQGRDASWRSPIWVRRMGCRRWTGPQLPGSSMRGRPQPQARTTPVRPGCPPSTRTAARM